MPCIESAWTYLCKNECHRAHQESLELYNSTITSSKPIDYESLKTLHYEQRSLALKLFKEKALGQNLIELEAVLV